MLAFYVGADPDWLPFSPMPLFVSHRRIATRYPRHLPQAIGPWALDSGAFTQITLHGCFVDTPAQYVEAVKRYRTEIGRMTFAAPQDHMSEPQALARSTLAKTVPEAQAWTVANYVTLHSLDASLPFIPVLQGWLIDDYLRCIDAYLAAGVDLSATLVGLGSVCRRQSTPAIGAIVTRLHAEGLKLHGFGVKTLGLASYASMLASADSMSWSLRGRHVRPCPHDPTKASCNHCYPHAYAWRMKVLAAVG